MTKYLVEETTLTDIADAIREQTGDENPIMLSNFASQIANISGSTTVKKYTAELTSSQYGWFTFVDENGNVITRDSTKIPVLATAIDGAQYFFGSFFSYESQNRYLFKVYDINNSNAHGYENNSKTFTFDLVYVESSTISGGGHSYSTSEQIVGTWIDGSTLYEKTYVFGKSDLYGGEISTDKISGKIDIDRIGYGVIFITDSFYAHTKSSGQISTPSNYPIARTQNPFYVRINVTNDGTSNSGYDYLYYEQTYGSSDAYNANDFEIFVTLRYTKSA